jgi:hypothetical protein
VAEFRCRYNSASKRVLNALKMIKLVGRKTTVERVAVVKLGVNKRSSDSAGSFVIERATNTTKITDV